MLACVYCAQGNSNDRIEMVWGIGICAIQVLVVKIISQYEFDVVLTGANALTTYITNGIVMSTDWRE